MCQLTFNKIDDKVEKEKGGGQNGTNKERKSHRAHCSSA